MMSTTQDEAAVAAASVPPATAGAATSASTPTLTATTDTTTASATRSTTTSKKSVRYQRLLQVLRKALERSKQQLNYQQLVEDCYGDDANIFENDTVLPKLLEQMIEKVNENVQTTMIHTILPQRHVEERLLQLEQVIQYLDHQDAQVYQKHQRNKEQTQRAIQNVKLPPNLTLNDLIQIQNKQLLLTEQHDLQSKIDAVQQDITVLQVEKQQLSERVQTKLHSLQELSREMERAADVCSMMS